MSRNPGHRAGSSARRGTALGLPALGVLPEYCSDCGAEIRTLESCVLTDGTEKMRAEVTFRERVEGVWCRGCSAKPKVAERAG